MKRAIGSGDLPSTPDALSASEDLPLEREQKIPEFIGIKPSLGRIILEALPEADRTESGIWLAHLKEGSGNVCTVVAVCDPYFSAADDQDADAPAGPMYKVGEIVLIGKYNGLDVQIGRRKLIAIRESDVIGVLITKEQSDGKTAE